jgi:undecaprenyl phosphate-alpha-L-ara4FN deformylase
VPDPAILALKVDVDTLRGTREGVPNLVALLRRHGADATFLWSLGPDHTGRAIKRVFRPGFVGKVRRTSVVRHYGVRTLLYGTVLPGPDIGRRAAGVMCAVRDEGFEVGIHTWDHIRWQDGVGQADADWTAREMTRACERFADVFKADPKTHGAAGWQMNVHALRLTQRLGFDYCSDGRGTHPFLPVWNAELVRCPQLPTTLPTLDELIGVDGITEDNVAAHLLERTREPHPAGHVYTLHAELEGMRLAPVFEQLLAGWKAQGWRLSSTRALYDSVQPLALPRCEVAPGTVPGRSGTLLVQGREFLADVDLAAAA